MQFGEKSGFAIEAQFEGSEEGWLFGRLRFWIGGKSVGDFDDSCDLRGSARWGRRFLQATFSRTRPDLDRRAANEVYWLLYGRFVEIGATAPGESWERDPFVLDDIGESSLRDRASILAIRQADGRDRIVVRDHGNQTLDNHVVSSGTCDRVVDEYCSWVESLSEGNG